MNRKQIVLSSILLFFLAAQGALFQSMGPLDYGLSLLLYPLLKVNHLVVTPVKNFISYWHTIKELAMALSTAQTHIDHLQEQVIALQSQLSFLESYRELIDFKKRYEEQSGIIAPVLFRHISPQSHFLLVDAGSYKGVKLDMVAVYKNCLVGRVTELFPFYAKVTLITDKKSCVPAIASTTGTLGIHQGINQTSITYFTFVSHLDPVSNNDLICTTSNGLVFPAGFGLGRVQGKEIDNLGLITYTLTPLINITTINGVYLIERGQWDIV